jgi:hypothetical protein
MSRTFVRQDIQIRPSVTYTDNTAPSEAAFETNPAHIEDDLNNMRSQLHNLLKNHAGNWWDDLNIPSTLETGTERGVNDLNTALHAVEKKRVLRCVGLLADVTVPASAPAGETLTLTANVANTETVTIDGKTYTFQTVLTDVDGNVLIGATASDSLDNLIAAINLGAGAGSLYAASTTAHPSYTASAGAGDTMDIASTHGGTHHNGESVTEGLANGAWGAAVTSGGAGDLAILGAGELPGNTTAAVGGVTTLGTVVAYEAAFASHSLAEVTGSHALKPKNLLEIVDGATGDPILSAEGKRVWGLMQSETITDGHTITDTTTTRVQISFVHANATNDDLIEADGDDIGGKTINYCYVERVRLEDLNEDDFLNTAAIDIGAGAATVTRQVAYNNQGTTPVELATNADLDLAAGVEWTIRDLANADLFQVVEGSGGGTSSVNIASDVDTFDVNAADNDFLNGASFDTGAAGTTINIGETANQIDSGGALTITSGGAGNLKLASVSSELRFTDSNEPVGWSEDGIQLSDAAQTWTDFEAAFGEVGLMDAIIAANANAARSKGTAVVTAASISAGTNVTGGAGANIDAQLPDYSGVTSFQADCDVFVNGVLMRGDDSTTGANDHDVYPGDDTTEGDLKFEFTLRGTGANADVITMIVNG